MLLLPFIILIHEVYGQAFTLCAYGHRSPNKYIAGKTTYFKSPRNLLWESYNHPPETPNMTYIYEDYSTNDSCWTFGTTSNFWNIIDEQYDEITKVATCSICDITSVPFPYHCPLWDITGYGIDTDFTISTDEVCEADDWNDTIHAPLSICSWNISSDEYYFMNDETWYLYTVDTHNNIYYYNPDDVKYMYQYYDTSNDKWLWAISEYVGDTDYKIYCEMQYSNQDISQCESWHFYDKEKGQFQANNDIVWKSSECPEISDIVCVYDSSKAVLNGQYELKAYRNDYDGWKKDNLYLIYRDLSWYITSVDVSITYASCASSSPYNPMECNHQWTVYDLTSTHSNSISDTLQIWNSTCDTTPTTTTAYPSMPPTTSNPTNPPTLIPTNHPTLTPTHIPTIMPTQESTTKEDDVIITDTVNVTTIVSIAKTETTQNGVTLILPKYYESDTRFSTDTFVVMLGIGVLVFICCFFGICGIVYYCRRSSKDRTHENKVYEQPRIRETIDEYITLHLQEKVDRCLQESMNNNKTAMDHVYNERAPYISSPASYFGREGKPVYENNNDLYLENDYPYTTPYNDDAMTQSYPSQQQHCEYHSSESIDINNGMSYDHASPLSPTETHDNDKRNGKTHVYHIVIDEDDVLNEEELNRQINAHHQHGMFARKSIGDQSVHSRITDASFGSNQTEEKEDNAFYNTQKYKRSRLNVTQQTIEEAIFPGDDEGVETIETAIKDEENRARESVKLTGSSPSPKQVLDVSDNVGERKSFHMTPRGYMDQEYEVIKKKVDESINKMKSPRALDPPPNSEVHSPSSSTVLSHDKSHIDMDKILNLKHMERSQDKHRKSRELTPKGHVHSMSRRSGRSFVTLFDEKKDIEADHLEDIDLENEHSKDLDDYLEESNTEDLSKQLFGTQSEITNNSIINIKHNKYHKSLSNHHLNKYLSVEISEMSPIYCSVNPNHNEFVD